MITVLQPAACPRCHGSREVPDRVADRLGMGPMTRPCEQCCCHVCGKPTDTPPICRKCDIDEDTRAVRREDGAGE